MNAKSCVETMYQLNPYSGFGKPSQEEYQRMHKALREYGLTPDMFFGSWGRIVWDNCVDDLKEMLEESGSISI